jgi:hypothetical protein
MMPNRAQSSTMPRLSPHLGSAAARRKGSTPFPCTIDVVATGRAVAALASWPSSTLYCVHFVDSVQD